MHTAIQLPAITATGLLAGNELGTLIGSHPALRTLPTDGEIAAEQAITRQLGRYMPVYMIATLATAADRRGEPGCRRATAGAAASALMLAITLTGNVPLNERTLDYPADGDSREWRTIRRRWEHLHVARVLLDLVAFGCLTSALAEDRR